MSSKLLNYKCKYLIIQLYLALKHVLVKRFYRTKRIQFIIFGPEENAQNTNTQ